MSTWVFRVLPLLCVFALPSPTQNGPGNTFVNFETSLTSPIRLSPDGTRLFCVNNPNATLSVFDVATNPAQPALIAEIPVGMDPVSVNARTDDEVWVVNQESDSVSVVSVSKGIVTATLQAPDEPSDVVFASGNAFVSTARNNTVMVFNALSRTLVQTIPLFGGGPRQMAVSPDGSTVYVAFAQSGNGSTLISSNQAPPPPPPVNPALPPAPQQGILVAYNDPAWTSVVTWTMPDNDVASINASSLQINGYYSGVGTANLGIAVQPLTGNIYVSNTDSLNLIRFQTALDDHFVNNRISKITPSGTVTSYDLNPTVTFTGVPDPASLTVALAQPTSVAFNATGTKMYIAAFGTDRVAVVDPNGNVLSRIEIDPDATGATVNPASKRGPRGLAINNSTRNLYVMNRITDTISVINTTSNTVTSEIPAGSQNPTPAAITAGRGFLYDAKLSGNGMGSCAACHLDGENDHLDWDLGDPTGSMFPVTLNTRQTFQEHPMKGPMNTLTLRGLINEQPYHWRGDRPEFSAFNDAFQQLMGGNQISDSDMTAFTNFINTVTWMPNPYQNLDRSYPVSFQGGNAQNGLVDYSTTPLDSANQTCNSCHTITNYGSNLKLIILGPENQPMKSTLLRATYQKQLFSKTGQTIDGFGMFHDGSEENEHVFLASGLFPLLLKSKTQQNDIAAMNLAFDTGTAPAVGYTMTLNSHTVGVAANATNWATLEGQATANADLIAVGQMNGSNVQLLYNVASATYQSNVAGVGPFTHAQMVTAIQGGGVMTVMGVPFGEGAWLAIRGSQP